MKYSPRSWILLVFLLLCAGMMPGVSAFFLSSANLSPPGFQPAGTPMTVTTDLTFPAAGPTTFPPDGELLIRTSLVDPYWEPVLVVDGNATRLAIVTGGELLIPGRNLSYPAAQSVKLQVTLTGKIPSERTADEDMVTIQERDSAHILVSASHVPMPEVPRITQATVSTPVKETTTLKTFTPIPTGTTPASPGWSGAGIIALLGAALLAMRRR